MVLPLTCLPEGMALSRDKNSMDHSSHAKSHTPDPMVHELHCDYIIPYLPDHNKLTIYLNNISIRFTDFSLILW